MNSQIIICNNCKTPNPARNLYCQSCGRPLIPAGPSASSVDATLPIPGQPHMPPQPVPETYIPPQAGVSNAESPYTPVPGPEANTIPVQPASGTAYPYPPQPEAPADYPPPPPAFPSQPAARQAAPKGPGFFQKTAASAESLVSGLKQGANNAHADGWADLVSGAGDKAAEIEQAFVEDFNRRGLSYVDLSRVELTSGLSQRAYQVIRHRAGSVTVYAAQAGSDLMLGWDLNVTQKAAWSRILILGLVALAASFLTTLFFGYNFLAYLVHWIFGTLSWALPVSVLGLIAGQVMKGDLWYFFIEKPDEPDMQELKALAAAAHQSLQAAVRQAGLKDGIIKARQ